MATRKNEKEFKKLIIFLVILLVLALFLFFIIKNFETIKLILEKIVNKKSNLEYTIEKRNYQNLSENLISENINTTNKKILISEIFIGDKNLPPFIEIYNPTSHPIDLSDFTIKKLTLNGEKTLVTSKRLENKIIEKYSYLLISKQDSPLKAQVYWPKSYKLKDAYGIIIYDKQKEKIDEIYWDKNLEGKSLTRKSWSENEFIYSYPTPYELN